MFKFLFSFFTSIHGESFTHFSFFPGLSNFKYILSLYIWKSHLSHIFVEFIFSNVSGCQTASTLKLQHLCCCFFSRILLKYSKYLLQNGAWWLLPVLFIIQKYCGKLFCQRSFFDWVILKLLFNLPYFVNIRVALVHYEYSSLI